MVLSYGPLETIQNISEPFFSKIKNEKDIWGGHLKWDTLYIYMVFFAKHTDHPSKIIYIYIYIHMFSLCTYYQYYNIHGQLTV